MVRIVDWEGGGYCPSVAEVRRFRCAHCGATDSSENPQTEGGFRISRRAADMIVEQAVAVGVIEAAHMAGVDKATVSRLLGARADQRLSLIERPRVARVVMLDRGAFCVADAWTGNVVAFFAGSDPEKLMTWLSLPYPSVIVVCRQAAPIVLGWRTAFKISITNADAVLMAMPLIERSATRMISTLDGACARSPGLRDFLSGADASESQTGEIARPGSPTRYFVRTRDALIHALMQTDLAVGRRAIADWRKSITDRWAEVFGPVLDFLRTYDDLLFSHPICVERLPDITTGNVHFSMNVMSLALKET